MVEGARLESVFRGNSNVGSNPTLSAILFNSGARCLTEVKIAGCIEGVGDVQDPATGIKRGRVRGVLVAHSRWRSRYSCLVAA